jgi:hypothetical protein
MAGRYNQAGTVREVVRPYKLASRLQLALSIYTRRRQHLQKENISEEQRGASHYGLLPGLYSKEMLHYSGLVYN